MSITLATPGVYIDERSVFPNSVVSVPTAVPAFIGYTYKADRAGKSLVMNATRIGSFTEFQNLFGGPPLTKFTIGDAPAPGAAPPPPKGKTPPPVPTAPVTPDFSVGTTGYTLTQDTKFILYNAIRLYYANGGGDCYIVSVGTYGPGTGAATALDATALTNGIAELVKHPEPTMVVIPEAVMLTDQADCTSVQQAMLMHCGDVMKSRIAILDVFNGYLPRTYDDADVITQFRNGVINFLDFGAAYYPWVETSIVQSNELDFRNLSNADKLVTILNAEADLLITDAAKATSTKTEYAKVTSTTDDAGAKVVHQLMLTTSPAYKNIMDAIRKEINLMAPSPAMAGIYCMVDNNRAVWKAPANVGVSSVIAPAVNLSDKDQQDLNVTLSGKSVNAIRSFTGEGVKCWGARTLDGNSQDWRYINVRRTMIFLEQSIKAAAKAYVFEPNDPNTWVSIKSMLNNFLNDVWKQGGLVGAKPEDAFIVDVGEGTTMTPVDILDGIMRITVKVAISHPAEFIVITFEQKMQQA
jgi:phage tail sheath protein FI